jgi:broad specificity phosphatase PhoE
MARVFYLSHPEVVVDAKRPVPHWSLSTTGRARCTACAESPVLAALVAILTSEETKAVETADLFAAPRGLTPICVPNSGENDRSATGFVPEPGFSTLADAFFAAPTLSVRGWERAIDAQARIVDAIATAVGAASAGDVLICGHGAVGTLLYCHHAGLPVSRRYDQRGGGNVIAYDRATMAPAHAWRRMEEVFHA